MGKMLRAHFDGKVIIPDEAVDLPVGQSLWITVRSDDAGHPTVPVNWRAIAEHLQDLPMNAESKPPLLRLVEALEGLPRDVDAEKEISPLAKWAKLIDELPSDPDAPTDMAAQVDHYLYGHPKRQ